MRYYYFFLSLLFGFGLEGQELRVRVLDTEKEPLVSAYTTLVSVKESATYYSSSDLQGYAYFKDVKAGEHLLSINYLGFAGIDTVVNISSGSMVIEILLKEDATTLAEVTVATKRPLISQDGEKIIIDPTPLLDFSTNVLEILELTPGLFVDPDAGVFIGSTSPASIFINGREQRLGNQDVTNLLRSLPPGSIQRIELIRNPSSRYDAASSGGILNIVLKKGYSIGKFGSVNLGMNQGDVGNRFGGFNLYSKSGKTGWYLNANYNRDAARNDIQSSRISAAPFVLNQEGVSFRYGELIYLGLGGNYEFNEKTSLSYDGRINVNINKSNSENQSRLLDFQREPLSQLINVVDNRGSSISYQHDIGVLHKLDTMGSEIDFKASYSRSVNDNMQEYFTSFTGPLISAIRGDGDILGDRHFIQLQSDFTLKFPMRITLESGFKSSFLRFENQTDFRIFQQEQWEDDAQRNNKYTYDELINALYVQATKILPGNFQLKVGVRGEHTCMSGNQLVPQDTSFLVERIDLFPYLFLSRKFITIAGFALKGFLIYRKTLSRPSYQNLNPGIRILDQFNYESGNPSLVPQFTHNFEFNLSFDEHPIIAIGRNYTNQIISNVLYNDPEQAALTYNTFDNIGTSKETYFRLILAVPPGKTYFGAIGGQYNYLEYNGFYSDAPVIFQRGSWRLFTFHTLNITKTTKFSASGFVLINGQMNLMKLGDMGQINFTLTQSFLNKKLNVSVFMRDVFRTMVTPFELRQSDIAFSGERYADNQRWGMTLRYNFGIKPKDEKRSPLNLNFED